MGKVIPLKVLKLTSHFLNPSFLKVVEGGRKSKKCRLFLKISAKPKAPYLKGLKKA